MYTPRIFLIAVFGFIGLTLNAQTYTITPASSSANWTGYAELGGYAPTGTLQIQSGQLSLKNGRINSARIIFDMRSIKHEIQRLETHLKDEDFFHVKKYPKARFELIRLEKNQAVGRLQIKNTSREVKIPIEVRQTKNKLTVEGIATIDRTAFGIRYNSDSYFKNLGDQAIKNEFTLKFKVVAVAK